MRSRNSPGIARARIGRIEQFERHRTFPSSPCWRHCVNAGRGIEEIRISVTMDIVGTCVKRFLPLRQRVVGDDFGSMP
jgi:hypothetical protein